MIQKLAAFILAVFMTVSTVVSTAAAAEMTVVEKMNLLETEVYGTPQTGSLVERLGVLEKDLEEAAQDDALLARADKVYRFVFDNTTGDTSFMMQINAVEWALSHDLTYDAIKTRLENLETTIYGGPKEGALRSRMQSLTALAFPGGTVQVTDTVVPVNNLIKIRLAEGLDSRTAQVGDVVKYQAAEDIIIDGVLVVAQGEKGEGTVTKVKQHQNFGRDAQLEISFGSIEAIDGSRMDVFLGEEAKKKLEESLAMAAGASIAGMAVLGPVGIVGGAFVKGKAVELPAGTEMYIQTTNESVVYGFNVSAL